MGAFENLLNTKQEIARLEQLIRVRKFWRGLFYVAVVIAISFPFVVTGFVLFAHGGIRIAGIVLDALLGISSLIFGINYAIVVSEDRRYDKWGRVWTLEVALAAERDAKVAYSSQLGDKHQIARTGYHENVANDIGALRRESKRWRRVHSLLQSIIIIGSLATTTLASLSIGNMSVHWLTVGFSFVVGISAGFAGYFKFRERSFYLQQTADAIEAELHSFNLRIGRYSTPQPGEALGLFVEEVERLKGEQRKREQSLDQPPESSREVS